MIYYDTLTVRLRGTGNAGDPVPGETLTFPIPAQIWALTSVETDKSPATGSGTPKTMYRFATPYDLKAIPARKPPEWTAQGLEVRFLYDDEVMDTPAGYERHTIFGRLDHYEAVLESFG